MRIRFKLERVTGVVALSYLVLIPAAGAWGYTKIRALQKDSCRMWGTMPFHDELQESETLLTPGERLREVFAGRR